jgi:large subunit ribosomal protein L19
MNPKVKIVEALVYGVSKHPDFGPGDNITVSYKITEGNKERIQEFRGDVVQVRGDGASKMFTVRKISNGVGVERVFPLHSPYVDGIAINKVGRVRRAKLFYQRKRSGKASRIAEKRMADTEVAAKVEE